MQSDSRIKLTGQPYSGANRFPHPVQPSDDIYQMNSAWNSAAPIDQSMPRLTLVEERSFGASTFCLDPAYLLLWQPCRHVCIWLSQALRQGVLNVIGQTRLHEAFWVAQLAKQASAAASANCSLVLMTVPESASAGPIRANTSVVTTNAIFIKDSPNLSTVRNSPLTITVNRNSLIMILPRIP